ncbi:hypothetical protein BvCmsNSNP043_00037 [Escherichia coli]|nr:hypothetical protein BvCmsNSNP043_00037 [Escherichia coli]
MQPPEGVPHRLPEHWWSPEGDRINMLIFRCSVYPVKITLSAILFMYDQISIIIKQITKPCIYR